MYMQREELGKIFAGRMYKLFSSFEVILDFSDRFFEIKLHLLSNVVLSGSLVITE